MDTRRVLHAVGFGALVAAAAAGVFLTTLLVTRPRDAVTVAQNATATGTARPTETPRPMQTAIATGTPTQAPPTATSTGTPVPTETPAPTSTPQPTLTSTPQPTSTSTPPPTAVPREQRPDYSDVCWFTGNVQLTVPAGEVRSYVVDLENCGSVWAYTYFVDADPSDDIVVSATGPQGAVVALPRTIHASSPPHQLFFPVRSDGRYAIHFDNRHSPFADKTVVLEWWDERRGPQLLSP